MAFAKFGVRGDDRRGAGAHPAALRRRADAARRARLAELGVETHARRAGAGLCARATLRSRTARRRGRAPRRRQGSRHRRPAAAHARLGARGARARHGRPVRPHRRTMPTSMRDVWAIGDVTGEPMLAHRAMAQGEMVAEIIAGPEARLRQARDPRRSASPIPEIVSVGLSPDAARETRGEIAGRPVSVRAPTAAR